MSTLLLRCERGFLDSECGAGIDGNNLFETGSFNVHRMSHEEIISEINRTWGSNSYFIIENEEINGRTWKRAKVYDYIH